MTYTPGQIVYFTIMSSWLVFAVVANIAIVVVVARDKKMRSVTNLFICSIALSDLFLAGFALPQQLHDVSHADEYFEHAVLCRLVNATPVFCITCSIYSMMALSIERYRTIVQQSATTLRSRHAAFIIALVWVFSFALSTPTLISYKVVAEGDFNTTMDICQPTFPHTFTIMNGFVILFVSYIVPQCVLYLNYGRLVYFIWKRSKLVTPGGTQVSGEGGGGGGGGPGGGTLNTSAVSRHKVRIIKMLIWAAALFTVSWIPYFVLGTISIVRGTQDSSEAHSALFMVQLCLATFSTTYNMFLYLRFNRSFRESFLRQVCPCYGRRSAVGPSEIDKPTGKTGN